MSGEGHAGGDKTVGRAAFLGGLLAFVALVACSVIGVGHARTLEGSGNVQYWVIVAIVAATLAVVTAGLSRTPASTTVGEAARRVILPLAAFGILLFLWETIALGLGATSPFQIVGQLISR